MLCVDAGVAPSLIMWENLGYKTTEKFFRSILIDLIAMVLVGLSMIAVLMLKTQIEKIKAENPMTECSSKVTITETEA